MEVADSIESAEVREFIVSVQEAKRCSIKKEGDEDRLCHYIAINDLSLEHVPNEFLKHSITVWTVFSRLMPKATLIQNLGKITSLFRTSIHNKGEEFWVRCVEVRLHDDLLLAHSRIHPLTLLIALKRYEQGTQRNEKVSWTPKTRITKALKNAFSRSTRRAQQKGRKYLITISVGENMQKHMCDSTITTVEAAAAMVYSTIQSEDVEVILFNKRIEESFTAIIQKEDTVQHVQSIEQKFNQMTPGTGSQYINQDFSVPFIWEKTRIKKFDAIMVFTDSITSCGYIHPAEALKQYTEYMAILDYRFVVVAMTSDKYSVAASDNIHSLDVVGFDKMTASLIMDFVESSNSKPVFLTDDNMVHTDEDAYYYKP